MSEMGSGQPPIDLRRLDPEVRAQQDASYRAIGQLVNAYVDDKLNEFRHEITEVLNGFADAIGRDRENIARLQGNVSGLRDAVADLQQLSNESMPEHVYKQFIRSEAERLRIVKKVVKEDE